ncbi:DUF3558 domain-containing protein [Actinophytocola glycyrrhizae]|uniref:DUF3558 domain-containing protein n=1 Tax=Actinophytocola glycyrrhizae TaxID=2044873 RepID=A0ABV9SHU2_9PSEU
MRAAERSELRSHLFRLLPALFVVLAAGCTDSTAGRATPEPTSTTAEGTEAPTESTPDSDKLPTDGAPEVDDPIDTAKFQENPCLSLTSEQSADIFDVGAAGRQSGGPLGETCEWRNESTHSRVWIGFLDKDPRGLSAEYGANEDGRWAFFEPLPPIEGQPAVARGRLDDREIGICTVVVGASDEIAFETRVQLSQGNIGKMDPCAAAADVAGEAVKTIKAG